jgi:hypothetical protein
MVIQLVAASRAARVQSPGRNMAASASSKRMRGKAERASAVRIKEASRRGGAIPATAPTRLPIAKASAAAARAKRMDVRAP